MPPPTAPVPQDAHRGEHRRVNPSDDDEQMGEISVILGGSMSIVSKTQGKKTRAGDQPSSAHRAREKDEMV
jgi:hypothetical protein